MATIQKAIAERADRIEPALLAADERCRLLMTEALESLKRPAKAWLADLAFEIDAARAVLLDVERHGALLPDGRGTTYFWGTDNELDDAFLNLWSLQGGLRHAVEMLVRCHSYELVHRNDGLCLDAAENWKPRWCPHDGIWSKLRVRLTTCADAEYEASRKTAEVLRARSHLALRCSLDYAFPQEAEWAAVDAARVLSGEAAGDREGRLLACLRDPALAEQIARASGGPASHHVQTMVDLLGPAAALAIEALILGTRSWAMEWRRRLARQLTMIQSAQVASFFAHNLADPGIVRAASAYFERWPDLACPALREAAAASTPRAAELLGLLDSRRPPDKECAPTPAHDSTTGREGQVSRSSQPAPPPGSSELPLVLAAPPWLAKGKPKRKPAVVREVVLLSVPESIAWKGGEREFHRSGRGCKYSLGYPERWGSQGPESVKEAQAEHLTYFQRALETTAEKARLTSLFWLSDETALATWNSFPPEKYEYSDVGDLHRILARHELAALPGLLAFGETYLALVVDVLARVRSPRVAPLMAAAHADLTRGRRTAARWLLTFPKEAAIGLIPEVVGAPGQRRQRAEAALRFLGAQGQEALIREVAQNYSSEVSAAISAVLAVDPYGEYPRRLPELPLLFWTPSLWPRPKLKESGQPLPDPALQALGTMLAFSASDDPYVGIRDVKRTCDARSLGAFAWALFEAWQKAGAPAKGAWAFHALGLLGDDETARQLAALVEPWSKEGRHGRAVTALRVLAAMDTDAALARVREIAEKAKSRPLRHEARLRLDEIAERRGLSADQLADLLVPDLGLDASGTRTFDLGPRRFLVRLDEQLKPVMKDQNGRPLRDLPEPGAKDDVEQARAVVADWKAFKKRVRAVLKAETARLELAMCSRRRWEPGEFDRVVVAHAVLGWLARRLIWGAYDEAGHLVDTFRVAEDRTLAGPNDSSWRVPSGCSIGLAHAVEMEDAVRAHWSTLLADYELQQPFVQLDREVFRATHEDLPTRAITVLVGHKVAARKLLSLESRGWDRVGDKDIGALVKSLHALECDAELPLDPGLFAGDLFGSPEQTLGPVIVRRRGTWSEEDCLTIQEMGPVLYSDLVRDLMSLRV